MPKSNIEIIYHDQNLLVINKPTGVSVTRDRSGKPDVLSILKEQLPDTELRLIHRLDKLTSGAMLLAKNLPTQSKYSSMFEKRQIKKTYLALVTGMTSRHSGVIRTAMAQDKRNAKLMRIDSRRGKPAVTQWQLLANFGNTALLAVKPVTGRTHQIRVHMASIGLPLAIDPLYGSTRPIMLSDVKHNYRLTQGKTENPLIDRLTLHAYQLEIPPSESCPTVFTAELDKKFAAAIKMLTKHNPNAAEAFTDPNTLEAILNGKNL